MGFPDFQELFGQPKEKRYIFFGLYVLGLISWILLLPVLTNPAWFMNNLFYYKNIS
jgi:prenyl protein peptidase